MTSLAQQHGDGRPPTERSISNSVDAEAGSISQASFGGIIRLVARRRWILLASTFAALTVALAFIWLTRPTYRSVSTLWVQQSGPRILGEAAVVVNDASPYLHTQCEVIRSQPVFEAALSDAALAGRLGELPGQPLSYLQKHVSAEPDKVGDIISVAAEAPSASLASVIVKAVVAHYIDFQQQQQRTTNARVIELLETDKTKLNSELLDKRRQMDRFHKDNTELPTSGSGVKAETEEMVAVMQSLNTARLESTAGQAVLEMFERDPETAIEAIGHGQFAKAGLVLPDASQLREEYRRRLQTRRAMTELYGAGHSFVRAADADIAELEKAISRSDALALRSCSTQVAASKARVSELQARLNSLRMQAAATDTKLDQYEQLQASAAQIDRTINRFDDRIDELHATKDSGGLNVSMLREADVDPKPVNPKAAQTLGMALVVGLMLGLAGALVSDWIDDRVRAGDAVETSLGIALLGVSPDMNPVRRAPHSLLRWAHRTKTCSDSHLAESFRGVRTSIRFALAGRKRQVLLITSASVEEGKTTVAANLASTFAAAGSRVLLIDADCRKPSLHEVFNIDNNSGLCDVLVGRMKLEGAVRRTGTSNVDVLPSGRVTVNPAEMFSSIAFEQMLEQAGALYDHILLDSPPVSIFADARLLAASADATVLVARAERSRRVEIMDARNSLEAAGADVIGLILNGVPVSRSVQKYSTHRVTSVNRGSFILSPATVDQLNEDVGCATS